MKHLLLTPVVALLIGCATTHDFIKDVESKNYDALATMFDKYCALKAREGAVGLIARQEALELRREIRQRIERCGHGPTGPAEKPQYLDDKTAYACGAVVRVYCKGESVPADVWEDFVRIRD